MPLLDWVNKAQAVEAASKVPYRLLQFRSAHGDESADNLLIQGDNLAALKALVPFYRGHVKCVFIDPPYNTQSAFEHYDDKLEHSQWLSMMYPRLILLRDLLTEDGSLWMTLDDNEAHYAKVLMDEVFGRSNFLATVVWEKADSPRMDARFFSGRHDFLLVYAKNAAEVTLNRLHVGAQDHYNRVDADGRRYYTKPLRAMGGDDTRAARPSLYFPLTAPDGTKVLPVRSDGVDGRWRWGPERVEADGHLIEWVQGRSGWAPYYRIYADDEAGRPAETVWTHEEVGSNRTSKAEVKALFGAKAFDTPKPEGLIQRVLELATAPNDLVMDSFLGSGTTAAVAHKMGRRWIGVEVGEHAQTRCLPRLLKVVEGEGGGVSNAVEWKGGGGFRYYTLGEALFDAEGGINPTVEFGALAGYVWHFETGEASPKKFTKPLLGVHEGTAYYLLYHGVLGDRQPQGGNVLTAAVLKHLDDAYPHKGPRVIYGEMTRLGEQWLRELDITFKQVPYDVRAR
jgi:adenine-specific DNA-methyltransferase